MRLVVIAILFLLQSNDSSSFVINRAILSSDTNPVYLEFWPLVAHAWKKIGIQPTLILIADPSVIVDTTIGDVIRFDPIEGIPTGLQAQVIRLLAPALFENEICIISDIDMVPVDRDYFIKSAAPIADDCFLVYRIIPDAWKRVSMCYNAAKGVIFQEIFNIKSLDDIIHTIKIWARKNLGYVTDEKMFYEYLMKWPKFKTHCKRLNHNNLRRLDKTKWVYQLNTIAGQYIDIHCPGPYSQRKIEIDNIMIAAGVLP